jgi:hypothetical protein
VQRRSSDGSIGDYRVKAGRLGGHSWQHLNAAGTGSGSRRSRPLLGWCIREERFRTHRAGRGPVITRILRTPRAYRGAYPWAYRWAYRWAPYDAPTPGRRNGQVTAGAGWAYRHPDSRTHSVVFASSFVRFEFPSGVPIKEDEIL